MASITLDTSNRSEVEQKIPTEVARIRELEQQELLVALYVPEGSGAPDNLWLVFNGDSRETVQRAVESLPLYSYMQVEITPLRDFGRPR